jgi:hypothetical protein
MAVLEGQDFAARHWGGPNVVAEKSPATYGRRDVDGGRPRFPAGWAFTADGFTYRVWRTGTVWHMAAHDGSFATFERVPGGWRVDGMSVAQFVADHDA